MSKVTVFQAWLTKAQSIADSLGVALVMEGINADTSEPYSPSPDEEFLSVRLLWGNENRPYLNGKYGQTCNSIVQIDYKAKKDNPFNALNKANEVAGLIDLDESIGGAVVFNKQIAPAINDETHTYHPISVTIKDVNLP